MNKWHYYLAIITFVVFCIIWATYDKPFVQALDSSFFDLFYGNKLITMFHYLGETKLIFSISFILLLFIWSKFRDYKLIMFVLLTVGVGYGLYQFLKHLIERPRPDIVDQLSTYSFPSGHAVHGLLYLLTITYVIHKAVLSKRISTIVWIVTIILIFLIGFSRITEGRHFASDVVAGWMIGYSWFTLCIWWYEQEKPR